MLQYTHHIDIIPARLAYLDQIYEIDQNIYAPGGWSRDSFIIELNKSYGLHYILLTQDEKLRAYIFSHIIDDEIHIINLAVHTDHRLQGYAKALISHIISLMPKYHIKSLLLEVRANNQAAINLYKLYDFEIIAQRLNYYPDTGEDAAIMRLTLNP